MSATPTITVRRPIDTEERQLAVYVSGADKLNLRSRVALLPLPIPTSGVMMARNSRQPAETIATRVHRLTHAPSSEMKRIFEKAGWLDHDLEQAIESVVSACDICCRSGIPKPSKKISFSHINESFNSEIQFDVTYPHVRGKKRAVLHLVDCGTAYSETCFIDHRCMDTIISAIQTSWFNRHGNPSFMSADDEFDATRILKLKAFLRSHDVTFKPRPVRRHNKIGIVERKNRTLKSILERLQSDNTAQDDSTILARATFLSNLFAGSSVLSSFELARGYTPSLIGQQQIYVTEELLEAHQQQAAVRALQRALRSRTPSSIPPRCIKPGDRVYFYFYTTSHAQKDEWRPGIVKSVHDHFIIIENDPRKPNARPSKIAYEDVRIRPQSDITSILMSDTVEHFLELTHEGVGEGSSHALVAHNFRPDEQMTDEDHRCETSADEQRDVLQRATRDIGSLASRVLEDPALQEERVLTTAEQNVLVNIESVIGKRQVSGSEMQFAPPWILDRAVKREIAENWTEAYEPVHRGQLQKGANIISSHFVYRVKTDELGVKMLKARLVIHGNRDADKDLIRKDAVAANLFITRFLLSVGTLMHFKFGVADIKGAFMQSGPITRELYVKPPKLLQVNRNIYWKLKKLPYGVADASRQWLKVSDKWMHDMGFTRVFGVNQLFVLRGLDGAIKMIVAKTIDDFLVGGEAFDIHSFFSSMSKRFEVGKIRIASTLQFNGCEIEVTADSDTIISMKSYITRLKPIDISRTRRQDRESLVTEREMAEYRSLAGTLVYLGASVLPPAAYVVSAMQQKVGRLTVSHLVEANDMLREVLQLDPSIRYRKPDGIIAAKLVSFSDASHGGKDRDYGQTGGIIGIKIEDQSGSRKIYHVINWTSHKQRRTSHSSFGAEIIAAADVDDRGFDLREMLREVFPHTDIDHELIVDSKALFDTITTLHEAHEYRLRRTVTMLRDAFESGQLNCLRWLNGKYNIADALTKRNRELYRQVDVITTSGLWDTPTSDSKELRSELWR